MDKTESPQEFVVLSEEAIQYLPEELRSQFYALKNEGRNVLEVADDNLRILNRLVHSLPVMASLRHIQSRLSSTRFAATIEWVLENDMLILAFVTTYARLVNGGVGSGVARTALPPELRPVHDNIIELRNQRYAHNDRHASLTAHLDISYLNGVFDINVDFNMGGYVGGAREWSPLIECIDGLIASRIRAQLQKLKEKTGREWTFASGSSLGGSS